MRITVDRSWPDLFCKDRALHNDGFTAGEGHVRSYDLITEVLIGRNATQKPLDLCGCAGHVGTTTTVVGPTRAYTYSKV